MQPVEDYLEELLESNEPVEFDDDDIDDAFEL